MLKKIISIISLVGLVACSEVEEKKSPANAQIAEYTKKLVECAENKTKTPDDKLQDNKDLLDKNTETSTPNNPPISQGPVEEKHVRGFGIEVDDLVLGNEKSKVVVMEYFSPTCPHCVVYQKKIFPELAKKYIDTNRIAYVTREFIGNKQDLDATILARCEGSLKSYHNFMKIILEQQDSWAFSKNYREILTNIGTLGGVNPEKYANCLNDEEKIQVLMENTKLIAKEPQFIGTPAFFINGKKFNKPYTVEELSKAIEALLNE
ncbi:MAG: protein-disulfide reductase [Rickettsiales bacterium]|nr:MAG: protein-disulfide reductase [Rickettsiales bacterium]